MRGDLEQVEKTPDQREGIFDRFHPANGAHDQRPRRSKTLWPDRVTEGRSTRESARIDPVVDLHESVARDANRIRQPIRQVETDRDVAVDQRFHDLPQEIVGHI